MDKLSRSIINFILKQPSPSNCTCSLNPSWDHEATISFSELTHAVGLGRGDILKAVDYLVRNGLAGYNTLRSRSGPVTTSFFLTHEGLHHKEFRLLTSREKWIERAWGFLSGAIIASIPWVLSLLIG